MPSIVDGPSSPQFAPVPMQVRPRARLRPSLVSEQMRAVLEKAPSGHCVGKGISFAVEDCWPAMVHISST